MPSFLIDETHGEEFLVEPSEDHKEMKTHSAKNTHHRNLKTRMQTHYLNESFQRTERAPVSLIIYLAHSSSVVITEGMNVTDLI